MQSLESRQTNTTSSFHPAPITDTQVAHARLNKAGHRPLGRTQSAPLPLVNPMLNSSIPSQQLGVHYEDYELLPLQQLNAHDYLKQVNLLYLFKNMNICIIFKKMVLSLCNKNTLIIKHAHVIYVLVHILKKCCMFKMQLFYFL